MPKLKAYTGKDGYYISARPSNIGNITYQVNPNIWEFLEELGYGDESEIEWGLLKPLRVAGLIYTNNSGVSDDDEGVPGLDPTKLTAMSTEEVEEILNYLKKRSGLNVAARKKIETYIEDYRTNSSDSDNDELTSEIKYAVKSALSNGWEVSDVTVARELAWNVFSKVPTTQVRETTIKIYLVKNSKLLGVEIPDSGSSVTHTITVVEPKNEGQTIPKNSTEWKTERKGQYDWNISIEILEHKAALAKALQETLTRFGISLGTAPELA